MCNTHYDYLIVGSGLFGATFAYKANKAGKKCLVIDKRPQLGGNVYCENIEGIRSFRDYGCCDCQSRTWKRSQLKVKRDSLSF